MQIDQVKLAVVGLGYVGLPLAVEFGKRRSVLGFDINEKRISELKAGRDHTLEVSGEELAEAAQLSFSSNAEALAQANVFIVTVPTPIDQYKRPDLTPLIRASETIGKVLKRGDIVIYESTVYPGATEEDCVPVLEAVSGLRYNEDFYAGYSPERINPGDKTHRVPNIRKVTSGSTPEVADLVDALYGEIITAGTHKASSIRVAEAAKVIENIQRDVNIALVNELALIFDRLGIDTDDVLAAAGSKWNFLPFRPGLVGGHCIGVDPYYLLHKSESVGYHPDLIHTARAVNNRMAPHVVQRVQSLLQQRGVEMPKARILLLGITFKEDCPDLRNSRALDLLQGFTALGAQVDCVDPWASPAEAQLKAGVTVLQQPAHADYDAVVLAVAHQQFRQYLPEQIRALGKSEAVVYDVKSVWPREAVTSRL